ncbi:hypothetical protein RNAN_0539 [Rheinheimera nanhaiensis E407-8]|uniref:Uncharacterized protein n=1 Tax=Rheinheimera nanhaiensis E407-8 TaxID=562729 RepID=I1DU42_9GAMM|nr:hypothetical protein RNAN_0539 [Rheinheimera nanhaiensis E407-8]
MIYWYQKPAHCGGFFHHGEKNMLLSKAFLRLNKARWSDLAKLERHLYFLHVSG